MTKMKYIFYAGLALLLCAGCSKDHDNSVRSLPDAKITLQFKAKGVGNDLKSAKAVTKAGTDANELAGEANINNISALVFNETGSELLATPYYAQVSSDNDGIVTVTDIPAKATVARIVIIGNAGNALSGVTTYSELQSALCSLSEQSQSNLTMSSQEIITSQPLVAGDDNYLGYSSMGEANINGISSPLELTRLAARLDVVNIKTNFTRPVLNGRSVRIESITIANRKTASRYFSPEYWGAVMVPGNLDNSGSTTLNLDVNNDTSLGTIAFSNYVMENDGSESPTELQITATLSANPPYLAETRTFGAVINENGSSRFGHDYIKRNYVYKIALNFGDDTFDGTNEEEEVDPPTPPTPPTPPIIYGSVDIALSVAEWNTEEIDAPNVEN